MDDITAIASTDLQEVKDDWFPKLIAVNWHGKEIYVRNAISLNEMLGFVDAVVDACIDESGEYFPQFRDCMFRIYTIIYYTNIALDGDLTARYEFVYGSDLFDEVVNNIDAGQLDDIKKTINAKISYAVNANIRKFNDGIKQLIGVADSIKAAFGDVSQEEITSVIHTLSKVESVDEAKLAQAVVEAQNATKKKQNKRRPGKPSQKNIREVVAGEPASVNDHSADTDKSDGD